MNNQIRPSSFIALSDFHSCTWPLEKVVNYYLREYETIYILGDCTDRGYDLDGSGGLSLLTSIFSLIKTLPGRVVYVPGNHDEFLYNWAVHHDQVSYNNMVKNGGAKTYQDVETMRKNNPELFNKLFEWLGNLPIQRQHYFNNQRFVLAHALFNERLYQHNPNFSLKDLYQFKGKQDYSYFANVLWFRKGSSSYYFDDLPDTNSIMVIGHTPERHRNSPNLDLDNGRGGVVKVCCVDGGIDYNARMLKYDGGDDVVFTQWGSHVDTSELACSNMKSKVNNESEEEILKKTIVEVMKHSDSKENGYFSLQRINSLGVVSGIKKISSDSVYSIIQNYGYQRDGRYGQDFNSLYLDYINETIFDYIVECIIKKNGTKKSGVIQIANLFHTSNFSYITESIGNARSLAKIIGIDSLKKVVSKQHCKVVSDYVYKKFGFDYSK